MLKRGVVVNGCEMFLCGNWRHCVCKGRWLTLKLKDQPAAFGSMVLWHGCQPLTLVVGVFPWGPRTSPSLHPPPQRELKKSPQLLLPSSWRSAVVPVLPVSCKGIFLTTSVRFLGLEGSKYRSWERSSRSKPRATEFSSDKSHGWQRSELLEAADTATWTAPLSPILPCGFTWDLKRLISSSRCVLSSSPGAPAPRQAHSFYVSLWLQKWITALKLAF